MNRSICLSLVLLVGQAASAAVYIVPENLVNADMAQIYGHLSRYVKSKPRKTSPANVLNVQYSNSFYWPEVVDTSRHDLHTLGFMKDNGQVVSKAGTHFYINYVKSIPSREHEGSYVTALAKERMFVELEYDDLGRNYYKILGKEAPPAGCPSSQIYGLCIIQR